MIERNIIDVYNRSTMEERKQGEYWYYDARVWCAKHARHWDMPVQSVCGVVAALSPGLRWEANLQDANTLIAAVTRSESRPMVGVYGTRNRDRAWLIASGESPLSILGGQKVLSFYHNILDPHDASHVTIDRHAYCLAHGLTSTRNGAASIDVRVTPKRYNELAESYKALSRAIGLLPNQLQAITWLAWKRINESTPVPF